MIGIDFSGLNENQEMICIALGEEKTKPVIGALRGGFVSTLIIDEKCAKSILDL
jgi:DNA-binding transcriptional regulator LsrR (DeoR family)